MADKYVPRDGARIPMPGAQPDWPADGRAVNFANPYEARLVRDGDLVKADPPKPSTSATASGAAKKGAK